MTSLIGRPFAFAKAEVTLVVRRDGHDRAGSVRREHVVGDPDRDALPREDVRRERARVHARLRRSTLVRSISELVPRPRDVRLDADV